MDYISLGNQVKKYRRSRQFTQKDLAEKIGVSLSYIGHIENGTRIMGIDTMVKLCDALNCNVDDLLCDSLIVKSDDYIPATPFQPSQVEVITGISRCIIDKLIGEVGKKQEQGDRKNRPAQPEPEE